MLSWIPMNGSQSGLNYGQQHIGCVAMKRVDDWSETKWEGTQKFTKLREKSTW